MFFASRRRVIAPAVLAFAAAGALMARGGVPMVTQYPMTATTLMLKAKPGGSEKFLWVAKLPSPVLPAADPEVVGATLTLIGFDQTAVAPMPGGQGLWAPNNPGTLYRFSNPAAPAGSSTVKVAVIKEGSVIKVVGKDTILDLDDPAQGVVELLLTIGDDVYCSICDVPTKDVPGEFRAVHCEAPGACF